MPLLHPLVEMTVVVLWYLCARAQVKKKNGTKETQVQQIQMKMKLAVLLNERLIVSDYIFHCRL